MSKIAEVQALIDRCTFDKNDPEQVTIFHRICTELKEISAEDDSDRALLLLCVCLTRFHKRPIIEIVDIAKESLRRRETQDSIAYLCKAVNYNYPASEARSILNEIREEIKDEQLKNFINLFISLIYYKEEKYEAFCEGVESFRARKADTFNPYLAQPISTIRTNRSITHKTPEIQGAERKGIQFATQKASSIISISCDKTYFERYEALFFEAFAQSQPRSVICHLAVATSSPSEVEEIIAQSRAATLLNGRLTVTAWCVGDTKNVGPISASLRMMHIAELLNQFGVPVISLDFDSVLIQSIERTLECFPEADVIFRKLQNVAPWEHLTGGFTAVRPTPAGQVFAEHLNGFLSRTLSLDTVQWWVDQNGLESAYRAMIDNDLNWRHADIFPIRDRFVKQPTGSGALKLKILQEALNSVQATSKNMTEN